LLNTTIVTTSIEQFEHEVTRIGRWEGELLQTKKDGAQIVVASRWSLQRDENGDPIAILMTNNDTFQHVLARAELEKALRNLAIEKPTPR
jgi:hypothetical protein